MGQISSTVHWLVEDLRLIIRCFNILVKVTFVELSYLVSKSKILEKATYKQENCILQNFLAYKSTLRLDRN